MTRIKATSDIHIEYATNQGTGEQVDYMFMLTIDRRINDLGDDRNKQLAAAVQEIGGVEQFAPATPYTFSVQIARTFPADKVREEIEKEVRLAMSPLDLPANAGGGKIITGNFRDGN